jgi:hypothetical protein
LPTVPDGPPGSYAASGWATMDDSIRDRFAYHRKGTRFKMQLPLSITRAGSKRIRLAGFTLDISSHGVLFACKRRPDVGGSIEYLIRLHGGGARAVKIRCAGRVLRVDVASSDQGQALPEYRVAATMERHQFERGGGTRKRGTSRWKRLPG